MHSDPSRRAFLCACAASGLLLALTHPRSVSGASSKIARATTAGRRIHVFAKPFHAYSPEETAALLAEAGFEGIDFAVREGGHVAPGRVRIELARAVRAAESAGLGVDTITTSITRPDAAARDVLSVAADLGIGVYRLGNYRYEPGVDPWRQLQALKPTLEGIAKLNEELGIHGALQNHSGDGRVGAACWDLHELLRDHDARWLGCQFDIRHATATLGTSWPVALQLLTPWIRSVDLKDFRWLQSPGVQKIEDVPLGEGVVDLAGFLRRVREAGITPVHSLHLEYPPFEHASLPHGPALRALHKEGLRRERHRLAALLEAAAGPA